MEISRTGVAEAAVGIGVLTLQDKTGVKFALHTGKIHRYSRDSPGARAKDFETLSGENTPSP